MVMGIYRHFDCNYHFFMDDAFITPVKMLACTVIDLLCDGAAGAKEVKANFKPVMTKEEYVKTILALEQKQESR